MTRAAALAAVLLLAASACGSGSARGGSGVVTASGSIGSLEIDVSHQAAIVGSAGKPDLTVGGRSSWPGVPRYLALGYGCPHGMSLPGVGSCETVYYVNSRTRRLVAFETHSPGFHTTNGVAPGMDQNAADRLEHETPQGPWFALYESGRDDFILRTSCRRVIAGSCSGKVAAFMLESRHDPIGLTFT